MKLFNIRLAYAMGALALIMGSVNVSAKPTPKVQTSKKGAPKAKVVKPATSTTGATTGNIAAPATTETTGTTVTIKNNLKETVTVTLRTEDPWNNLMDLNTRKEGSQVFTIKSGETKKTPITTSLVGINVVAVSYWDCDNNFSTCRYNGTDEATCQKTAEECYKAAEKKHSLLGGTYPEDSSWSIDLNAQDAVKINKR